MLIGMSGAARSIQHGIANASLGRIICIAILLMSYLGATTKVVAQKAG
jgi:hypothetical protein